MYRIDKFEGFKKPRCFYLYLFSSVMYWTDWGSSAKIETANYDGTSRKVIIGTNLGWPNGLHLDTQGK